MVLRRRRGRLMLTKDNRRKRRAEQRLGPAQGQALGVQRNLLEDHGRLDPAAAEPQALLFIFPSVLSQIGPQLDRFVKREGPADAAVWLGRFLLPRLADLFEGVLHLDCALALGSLKPQADGLAHRVGSFEVLERLRAVEVKDQPVILAILNTLQPAPLDDSNLSQRVGRTALDGCRPVILVVLADREDFDRSVRVFRRGAHDEEPLLSLLRQIEPDSLQRRLRAKRARRRRVQGKLAASGYGHLRWAAEAPSWLIDGRKISFTKRGCACRWHGVLRGCEHFERALTLWRHCCPPSAKTSITVK